MMVLQTALSALTLGVSLTLAAAASGQVIEFESGGLRYQTLTRNGLTIMFAPLRTTVRGYSILQVAASNGSSRPCKLGPEAFLFRRPDGTALRAASAQAVVADFMNRGSRDDVVKLVSTYESGIYGMNRPQAVNSYEQRRRAALAEVTSTRLKAAAAASAIALVETTLRPGESTDGAVFFPSGGRMLGPGKLTVQAAGASFEFHVDAEPPPGP